MAVAVAAAAVPGCQPAGGAGAGASADAKAKPAAPAKVEGAPKEADLATITLTPEAEAHLGIALGKVERKPAPRVTVYAGEVTVPPGKLLAVTAPFNSTVKAPPGKSALPAPGDEVKEGQAVCVLVPILAAEAMAQVAPLLADADGQVKAAHEQLNIAKVNFDRAEFLKKEKLGGSAALEDAKNQYDLAQTNLKNAEARLAILRKVVSDREPSQQTVNAPSSGMIQNVSVQPNQIVAAGAPLFQLESLDPVWVKVAVFVGDVPRVDPKRPAEIGGLSDAPGAPGSKPGKPVAAPPAGDPLAATVHLFYEVTNKDRALRPGERVGVTLPLKGQDESLTVPRAALYHDLHGGTWVYEKVAAHKYARRRVLLDRVVGDLAVLASAPLKPGAEVVTDGAAELYGTEFGGGK
jgi:RND family efflux transporter MFP subunit